MPILSAPNPPDDHPVRARLSLLGIVFWIAWLLLYMWVIRLKDHPHIGTKIKDTTGKVVFILNKPYSESYSMIFVWWLISPLIIIGIDSFLLISGNFDLADMIIEIIFIVSRIFQSFTIIPLSVFLYFENPTQSIYSKAKSKLQEIGKKANVIFGDQPGLIPSPVSH